MQVYQEKEDGEIILLGQREFVRKTISSQRTVKFQQRIEVNDYLYNFFRDHYLRLENTKLQVVLEYIDNASGNQLMAQEFSVRDFYPIEAVDIRPESRAKMNFHEEFKQFISCNDKVIDLHKTTKISENGDEQAISLSFENIEDKHLVTVQLDFSKKDEFMPPKFLMALIKNVPSEDWITFYDRDYSLEFDIWSSTSINALQLEIKSDYAGLLTKIVDVKIETGDTFKHHSVRLRDYGTDPVVWKAVNEICFLSFSSYASMQTGEFKIMDLKLIQHPKKCIKPI